MSTSASRPSSHYDTLGVAKDADTATIRAAYRRLARQHHPDRHGGRTTPDMVRINEAWRVLSDARRRHAYDDGLASQGTRQESTPRSPSGPDRVSSSEPIIAYQPARFPWKFVVGFFAVVTAVILLVGAVTGPGEMPPIDNIIRIGSCVDVDRQVQEAWEISCDGPSDGQVVSIVPFDGRCPAGTETYRDRQGLGLVCVAA